jgi:hypothetical protein
MATRAQKLEETTQTQHPANNPVPSEETSDKITIRRPACVHLSPEETRARMEAFQKEREEAFVAAIREDENGSLPA